MYKCLFGLKDNDGSQKYSIKNDNCQNNLLDTLNKTKINFNEEKKKSSSIISKKDNMLKNKKINKCNHKNFFSSYCLFDSKNEGGLMCYECLYNYHKEHISKCIPIRKNNFTNYINFYKFKR